MGPEARCLRVAMLNADTSVPNVYADLGTFGDILHRKLVAAAGRKYDGLSIVHSVYNVVVGEYPNSLDDWDAVFITASAAAAYGDEAWIKKLEEYIVMTYTKHPDIKLFGSCFGHHIICQALLKDHGVRVARRPSGWEIGVIKVKFTDEFRDVFAHSWAETVKHSYLQLPNRLPTPESENGDGVDNASFLFERVDREVPKEAFLEFVHADEVVMPSPHFLLPKPWVLLGSTEHCKFPGVFLPGRVLTLQGHFEFDTFKSQETARIFGAAEASDQDQENGNGVGKAPGPEYDDGEAVVDILVRFLAEGRAVTRPQYAKSLAHADLPTP